MCFQQHRLLPKARVAHWSYTLEALSWLDRSRLINWFSFISVDTNADSKNMPAWSFLLHEKRKIQKVKYEDYPLCKVMPLWYYIKSLILKKLAMTQKTTQQGYFPLQKNRTKCTTGYLLSFPIDFMLCNCKGDQTTILLRALSARKQLSSVFLIKCQNRSAIILEQTCCKNCGFFAETLFIWGFLHNILWWWKSSCWLVLLAAEYYEAVPQL